MSSKRSVRGPWCGWALMVALAASACGQAPDVPGERQERSGEASAEAPEDDGTVSAQGYERQGRTLHGYEQRSYEPAGHEDDGGVGPVLQGFSLRSLAGGTGSAVDTGAVVEGTLQVRRSVLQGTTASLNPCASPTTGETRGCGWKSGGQWRCVAGTSVTLSTGACGVAGAEDTVLRVCRGTAPCEHTSTARLASNDDACGSYSARVTFTCPSSGSFSVLVAPYWSHLPLKGLPESAGDNAMPYFNVVQTGWSLEGAPVEAVTRDGSVIPMRIAAVHDELGPEYVHPGLYGPGTTYRYLVEKRRSDGQWEPLCGSDVDREHGEGLPVAIPVTGWWHTDGTRYEDPRRFTFSCGRGVITKCYRWGYRPWDGHSAQGANLTAEMLHQTCTRMARADYCGKGTSWTVDDTDINLWDIAGIQHQAASQPGHSFEAGWMPWGAICLDQKRWSHAPDDVFYEGCPSLFDHDQSDGGVQRTPRYCSSMEEAREKDEWTPLFNEAAENPFPGSAPLSR